MSFSKSKKLAYLNIDDRFNHVESSEESDVPEENILRSGKAATKKLLEEWTETIVNPKPDILHDIITSFALAVEQTTDKSGTNEPTVKNSSVFNDFVKLCFTKIAPSLQSVLDLPVVHDIQNPIKPNRSPKWKIVSVDVKVYLLSLLQMTKNVAEATMLDIVLKHIHRMLIYYAMFNKLSKDLMKTLITFWGSGDDTTKVLAFLCLNRLVSMRQNMLEPCLKRMYAKYVKNCKFTSPTLLPTIKFMQQSLVEILKIDESVTYQHAFIYIRQQAIHLRNALTVKKKDLCQAIYNWQYIRCLELWVVLISSSPSSVLENLIYPLVQVITGVLKLIPSVGYYPLRFHCVTLLNSISASTGKFIPVIPFIIDTFEAVDLNKKPSKISLKPISFTYMLRLSKSQIQEKAFKDALIDQVYEHLLTYLNIFAHSVSFPELVFPMQIHLKEIVKNCKNANYCKQLKQILEKSEENSKFITDRRNDLCVNLADTKSISAWERQCKEQIPPLTKFYTTWRKLRDREIMQQISAKDSIIGHDNFQAIKFKKEILQRATDKDRQEFSTLFESDDENTFADIFNLNLNIKNDLKRKKSKNIIETVNLTKTVKSKSEHSAKKRKLSAAYSC